MLSGPSAVEFEWRLLAGEDYDAAKVFLRPMQELATDYPCTHSYPCGCYHRVIMHSDYDIVAVCRCKVSNCDNIHLTRSDIIAYEIDRPRLHRAIADALSLELIESVVPYARNTTQVGFYKPRPDVRSAVFLTMQTDPEYYRNTAFILALNSTEPFILIVPTPDLCLTHCLEILKSCKAALLFLSDILTINDGIMSVSPVCAKLLATFRDQTLGTCKSGEILPHSEGFRSVTLGDRNFTLTPCQAQIIEILHRAWKNGTPDVGLDYIMEEIGSPSRRLRDIFKRDLDVFNILIRPGDRRGTYRLNK